MPAPPPNSSARLARSGVSLLSEATCPHCWSKFAPEDILWVSEHRTLVGDPKLGADAQRRFLPSRFSAEGKALDELGQKCGTLACPHCHLDVPRILLEIEPLFMSIMGTPTSGKSYFLAAMTWTLRSVLAERFAVSFTDVDPQCNALLNGFENALFMNPNADEVIPLGDLIKKTQAQLVGGGNYDQVNHGGQSVLYPRPFLFGVRTRDDHPSAAANLSRVLCLYDNAGEHFQPGMDRSDTPVTRHMARSRVLFFVFDPTQHGRVREQCRNSASNPIDSHRQDTVLSEAARRVREHAGLPADAKHNRPLIVILAKSDEWQHLLETPPGREPSQRGRDGVHGLDIEAIKTHSERNKRFLKKYCSEIVSAAEDFCPDTTYLAASALGDQVETDPRTGKLGISPRLIQPSWATVPMLLGLWKVDKRLIRGGRRPPGSK